MWQLRHGIRILFSGMWAQRRSKRRLNLGRSVDWLPPVFGPNDWSIGIMADRSAGWYFERDRA